MIDDSHNQSLSVQEEWIDITLDSGRFVAGERVSGEVLVQLLNNEEPLKILLKSSGVESVRIIKKDGQLFEHSVPIYTLNTVLSEITTKGRIQSVFPFSFKVPVYCPSTFHFQGENQSGAEIEISVNYTIEAVLLSDSSYTQKKTKPVYILNRASRQVFPTKTSNSTAVSSCCLSRGSIEISFQPVNSDHASCGGRKIFRVTMQSPLTRYIEGAFGQVVFELTVQVPGSEEFSLRKVVSRSVLPTSTLNKTQDLELQPEPGVGLDFEVNLQEMVCGSNPCSNEGAFFVSDYRVECYARYPLACQVISASCKMPLHVNPDVPVKDSVDYPRKWSPTEHLISNLITETCNGVPYPQGTLLVTRKRREVKLHVIMPDTEPFILFGVELRTEYSRTVLTKRFNDILVFQNKLCYFAHSFYSPTEQLMTLLPRLPLPQPSLITLTESAIHKRKEEVSKYFQGLCKLYNKHSFNPGFPWVQMIRKFLDLDMIEKKQQTSAGFIQKAFQVYKKKLRARHARQLQLRLEGYTSNIQDLPNELLIYLARYLNIKDLFNLTLVNKRFRDNTEQPILWTTINLFQSKIKIEQCIFEKLCFKAQKLRQIDLRYCQFINSEAMHAISQSCNPEYLEELYLDGCENIEDVSLFSLCATFDEVKKMNWELKGGAYGLKKLSLAECRAIQNTGLRCLKKLKRLEEINILGCYSITDEGVQNLVSKSKNFKKFNLSGTYVSREGLVAIKNNCPAVQTLILHGCRLLSADDAGIFKGIHVELRDDIFRFQLLPSHDTDLNSITNNILRTRSSLTIQRVAHYVCKKISLPVGSGIDIICKGKVLSSYMTLKGVEIDMWDSTMLTLHYRLKSETEKIKENEKVESLMGKMPKWEPDESVTECAFCKDRFRVFLRKHHCRNCGKIFCDKCSSKKVLIPQFGYTKHPVRVCDLCYFNFQR